MTPRQKNLAALDVIAQQHGYTVDDVLGPSRRKHLVHVRRLCILMLRRKGFSTTEIGRVMGRCHTTIVHALNKAVDRCNEPVVEGCTNNEGTHHMINWTKDERTVALMANAVEHYHATDEFSLEHEAQLELIRDEYLNELWNDFRRDDIDAFEEWHCQPTVEETFLKGIEA
jgi:hypothetical protein